MDAVATITVTGGNGDGQDPADYIDEPSATGHRLRLIAAAGLAAVNATVVIAALGLWRPSPDGQSALDVVAGWNWVGIGSAALAIATILLAVFAIRAAAIARGALEATTSSVDKMRLDLDLEFRPYLTLNVQLFTGGQATLNIRNVGRGPALDCVAAFHAIHAGGGLAIRWGSSAFFDLASGESAAIEGTVSGDEPMAHTLLQGCRNPGEETVSAVAYQDVQGHRYRVVRTDNETHTDAWRTDTPGHPPEWASWLERR